jgi:hypothetical protein
MRHGETVQFAALIRRHQQRDIQLLEQRREGIGVTTAKPVLAVR